MNDLLGKAQDEIERLKRALDDCAQETDHWREEVERLHRQIARGCGDETKQTPVANLPSLIENHDFITDCARYAEGLYSEAAVKKKYRFDDATWASLGEDEALIEAIEAERIRRVRSGAAKRERAQQHIVKGPDILEKIMSDESANARHRIDSVKALDALADNGPGMAPAADRYVIRIDLSADAKLRSAKPDPNDVIVIDATPHKTPAAITDQSKDDWKKW
jgi:hypothetical protein